MAVLSGDSTLLEAVLHQPNVDRSENLVDSVPGQQPFARYCLFVKWALKPIFRSTLGTFLPASLTTNLFRWLQSSHTGFTSLLSYSANSSQVHIPDMIRCPVTWFSYQLKNFRQFYTVNCLEIMMFSPVLAAIFLTCAGWIFQ